MPRPPETDQTQIAAFLDGRPHAVVGASADRAKYGNKVLRAYQQTDRPVFPVNPKQGVIEGLFRPIGTGIVDIKAFIETLEGSGYRGWYVLEQDCVLDGEPEPGAGPITDARASVEVLRELAQDL